MTEPDPPDTLHLAVVENPTYDIEDNRISLDIGHTLSVPREDYEQHLSGIYPGDGPDLPSFLKYAARTVLEANNVPVVVEYNNVEMLYERLNRDKFQEYEISPEDWWATAVEDVWPIWQHLDESVGYPDAAYVLASDQEHTDQEWRHSGRERFQAMKNQTLNQIKSQREAPLGRGIPAGPSIPHSPAFVDWTKLLEEES